VSGVPLHDDGGAGDYSEEKIVHERIAFHEMWEELYSGEGPTCGQGQRYEEIRTAWAIAGYPEDIHHFIMVALGWRWSGAYHDYLTPLPEDNTDATT
jgi:hypothetical protein